MKPRNPTFTGSVDVHAALARAHADRAEYVQIAVNGVAAAFKRLAAKLRHGRQPHKGAWA